MKRPKDDRAETRVELVSTELVDRCRSGDERAWAQLVEATYRQVYTLCLRILRDPDDAAEATQDAYLKAWRGLKKFRGEALFSTWMYKVATNAAISKQRRNRRRTSREVPAEEETLAQMPAAGSVEAEAAARLDLGTLEDALRALPVHYRTAVVLRDVYELSIEEIAKQLDISETAAKVRVHRARKKLRDVLLDERDEARA